MAETTVKILLYWYYINVGGNYVKNCSFQVRISYVLRFISICDPFTDSPSCYPCSHV
jgi:hypothetical protein